MIYVDSREPDTIKSLFKRQNIKIKIKYLPTFDYIINDKIGIERKCYPDLVGSVTTRRLYGQLDRMIGSKYRPFVLIEGHSHDAYRILKYSDIKGDPKEIAKKAMLSIAINYGIPIIHTDSQYETIEAIEEIAKMDVDKFHPRIPKPQKKLSSTAKVLSLIEGVGTATAVNISTQCGPNISTYTLDELIKVKGVGRKTAEKILLFKGDICG